jgi:hypothetical protein
MTFRRMKVKSGSLGWPLVAEVGLWWLKKTPGSPSSGLAVVSLMWLESVPGRFEESLGFWSRPLVFIWWPRGRSQAFEVFL